jgi:hypothetical protein
MFPKFDEYMEILNWIRKNKLLFLVLAAYAVSMISVINWGIPNLSHPFTYHMDEWHQLQAVRTTFRNFSANVPGSAHGTMFHFILSGLYLIPFFLLKIINPFILKSSLDQLQMQQRLFEILRLNTIIFGLLSIFFIAKIAKDYLKVNLVLVATLFAVTPLWISLSNYFKYDIALTFWIILSVFFLLKFGTKPTLKNYLIAGIFCSIAVATKISALPLFIIYLFSYFWFTKRKTRKLKDIFLGALVFTAVLIPLGFPDLVLGKGDYSEFLYSNLVIGPETFSNLITGFSSWWAYLLIKIFPIDFGYSFFIVYVVAALYWLVILSKYILIKRLAVLKFEVFLLFSLILFLISLIPLGIGANGNRLLVLLPYFAILSALFLRNIQKSGIRYKSLLSALLTIGIAIQIFQSAITIYAKLVPDVRQISSQWMRDNVSKNTLIGLENIPIYQMLPDIVLMDFYSKDKSSSYRQNYKYQIVDASTKMLPSVVIVTNKELELNYFKNSPKKLLVERLTREKYKQLVEFKPSAGIYLFAENYLNFYLSGLAPIPTISIFGK